MRVTITTLDAVVYQFAGSTIADDAKGIYRGRLSNQLNLARSFSELGSNLVTLQLQLINHDKIIPDNTSLWGASVAIEAEGGQQWSGKITAYESNADGKLIVTATERTAPELTQYLPDEFINLTTVTADMHSSSLKATIPLIIGGNATSPIAVKGILKSKTNGIYYLCVGEIHEIVKVRVGDKTLTRVEAEAAGYMTYTGSAAQASEPGIAYIHITDPDLRKNDDGSYVEIGAEVIGLKLGSHTVEECRNGARFLLWLLKTARTGVLGWGLGIAESDIDLATFATAITDVDTAGLKLDGTIYDRKAAQSWITEICRCIRGTYEIGENGKRRLYISKASDTSSYTYTKNNIELIRFGVGAYTGRVYNQGRLDYGYNPITGLFMQSTHFQDAASIAEIEEQEFEGSSYLVRDPATAQKILEYTCKRSLIGASKVLFSSRFLPANCRPGQLITIEYPEHSLTGLWKITSLQIGDHVHRIEAEKFDAAIFTVGAPGTAIDWTQDAPVVSTINPAQPSGLMLSSEVRPSPDGTNIVVLKGSFTPPAGKYLAANIEWGEGLLPILDWKSLGMAQGSSFEIAPVKPATDYAVRIRMITSTGHSDYITGTLTTQGDTVPPGAPSIGVTSYLKTVTLQISLASVPSDMAGFAVYRHIANNSAAAAQVGSITSKDGRATFNDEAPSYGQTYYYWVKSFDTWGNLSTFSDAALTLITAINGADIVDGALARSALFQAGVVDAAAIAAGAITAVKTSIAGIDAATGNIAANAVGELQLANNAVTAAKLSVSGIDGTTGAIAAGAVAELQLANDAVTAAKLAASAVETAHINNQALKSPMGAVLSLSAKNSTTASIAEAGGVRDVSGNSNHGQAFGGVQVADSEVGKAFSFDGVNDYVLTDSAAVFGGANAITFACWIKPTATGFRGIISNQILATPRRGVSVSYETEANIEVNYTLSGGGAANINLYVSLPLNELNHLVVTLESGTFRAYKNGELVATGATGQSIVNINSSNKAVVGRSFSNNAGYLFQGLIAHPRIYNRALSAEEIKTLYMLGSDPEIGTITADRVQTGELKSLNYSAGSGDFAAAGTMLDLNSGVIKTPGLSLDAAGNAKLRGSVSANSGSIGGFNIYPTTIFVAVEGGAELSLSSSTKRIGRLTSYALSGMTDQSFAGIDAFDSILVERRKNGVIQARVTIQPSQDEPITAAVYSSSNTAFRTDGRIVAEGGFAQTSNESVKSDIQPVNTLTKLKQLPVKSYVLDDYKIALKHRERAIERSLREGNKIDLTELPPIPDEPELPRYNSTKSIGLMAAEFNCLFGTEGGSDTYNLSDAIGVALRAIQELTELVDAQQARMDELNQIVAASTYKENK